jgi:hypothetical protein
MLQIVIGIIVILIAIVLFVIIKDIKERKRYEEEKFRRTRHRTNKPQPKVRTRSSEKTLKKEKTHQDEKSLPVQKTTDIIPEQTKPSEKTVTKPLPSTEEKTESESIFSITYTWQCEVPRSLPCPVICTEKIEVRRKTAETKETARADIELPEDNYKPFSHQRLLDMGLGEEDAKEFVQELIPQIEEQIPQIEQALEEEDFHKMERLTHSIKGSSTNVGTGGVADVLSDYNTYLKTGENKAIAARYLELLKTYLQKLKARYLG